MKKPKIASELRRVPYNRLRRGMLIVHDETIVRKQIGNHIKDSVFLILDVLGKTGYGVGYVAIHLSGNDDYGTCLNIKEEDDGYYHLKSISRDFPAVNSYIKIPGAKAIFCYRRQRYYLIEKTKDYC